uniref:Uncharacterized protein n=1 Tax=Glossina pallidipes TaxID=7398 RepID=A0A1A9Z2I0_GLOPL
MGDQLVEIPPSSHYLVEHYFLGHIDTENTFDSNMGNTRFFKVAKAKSEEGLMVAKLFVKHDPTLPLEDHKDRVEYIKKTLTLVSIWKPIIGEWASSAPLMSSQRATRKKQKEAPFIIPVKGNEIATKALASLKRRRAVLLGGMKKGNITINWSGSV